MIFYFSGTGNSKWIANHLPKSKRRVGFIPDALKNGALEFSLQADEKIGFVFPIYSWGPPRNCVELCSTALFKGYKGQYLFLFVPVVMIPGLPSKVLAKALKNKRLGMSRWFSVTMPNNYVLLPGFDVDNKELEEKN